VLLLNNDAVLEPGALRALVDMADARPAVGAVTGRLLSPSGRERYPAAHVWQRWLPPPRWAHRLAWVPGTAVLLRREALDAVGWLDEAFFFYNEDLDLSWRLRRVGWELWYCPAAVVHHHEGGSSQHIRDRVVLEGYRGSLQLARKHHGRLGYGLTRVALRLEVKARLAGLWMLQRCRPGDAALAARILCYEAVREILRAGVPPSEPVGVPATPEG
jgi:GT2 family glycosyltransferase